MIRQLKLLPLPMVLMIVMITVGEGGFAVYKNTQDCNGKLACALDEPSLFLNGTISKGHCALKCLDRGNCASFNYLEPNGSCLIFNTTPYKILKKSACFGYDKTVIEENRVKSFNSGENLARYKRTCLSTTNSIAGKKASSWLAVDDFHGTVWATCDCSQTGRSDAFNNWFMVDLAYFVSIGYVRILCASNNKLTEIRYKNLTIGITNTSWMVESPIRGTYPLCGVYLGPLPDGSWIRVTCQSSATPSRFVIVHQVPVQSPNGGYMAICEIQVFSI